MKRATFALIMAFLLTTGTAMAQLKLAEIFGSHMVIQQNTQVVLWGWAKPGDTIRVICSWLPGQSLTVQTDAARHWAVNLPTSSGSMAPQQIEVSGSEEKIELRDVLIGEVWLCSGQSNMEWRIDESGYTPEQTRAVSYPHIRHFKVNHAVSLEPLEHLDAGNWQVCNAETAQHFSAVGYFFARDLVDQYQVPIGLVNSSWGGSQVESWISGTGMEQSDLFKDYAANFPQSWAEVDARSLSKIKKYLFGSDRPNPDAEEEAAYMRPDFDVSGWKTVSPTTAWDWQHIWAFRGSGYMVFDFELSKQALTSDAVLHLGHGDLPAEVYINGRRIWAGRNIGGVESAVPVSALKSGKNRLIFKQKLADSQGWVEMGLRDKPEKSFLETVAGNIALGGSWRVMPSFSEPMYFVHSSNNIGTAIFNAMIHPIVRFPIKGVIWYQGESNAIRAHEYRQSFPLLIQDWRRLWGADFPFLFVQLANWDTGNHAPQAGSEWAELREAQMLTLQLPKTGMAVAIDIGESGDIHPKNKLDVGKRLAREAKRVAYNEPVPAGSPTHPQIRFSENQVVVSFPTETRALVARDSNGYVRGFVVAGEDQIFHPAQAEVSGNTILIQSPEVPRPVAVRYAWADDPRDLHLYTDDGFPMAPFRSDDWKCRTEGIRFE